METIYSINRNLNNDSSQIIQMSLTPDNKNNINLLFCRICFEDENSGELIDPCECSGSLKLVHTKCLEKWLSISNTDRCEICKYTFPIEKKDKPIQEWWKATRIYRWKGIVGDLIGLIVLTPLCLGASYMCAIGAITYSRMKIREGFGLAILCCMLVGTYLLWLFIIIRFHYKSWRHWCNLNQDIRLLVKHRNPNQSQNMNQRSKRNRKNRQNPYNTEESTFYWFSNHNHYADPFYSFYMNSSYV
ncbi:E3 ubiquitin-protein ligase MARCHF2-like isoform X2 [Leptopilina heterotoma]|uniref:E3 ubiquitin-protein ligase MARCHF2-like isoform X2 n=1 Tax=Leptopilina heterotoma TaxID=63436 RepID=UPI001CA8BDFF|nr:E3 ubiquitin-protein ligase MARCHF2-like isoform X2 [Leptopilina heterotoma]